MDRVLAVLSPGHDTIADAFWPIALAWMRVAHKAAYSPTGPTPGVLQETGHRAQGTAGDLQIGNLPIAQAQGDPFAGVRHEGGKLGKHAPHSHRVVRRAGCDPAAVGAVNRIGHDICMALHHGHGAA